MARARKVPEEEALRAAMGLFWRAGYAGAGTRQIEDETGITRFTLQTVHGGKRALFLSALDLYLDLFEPVLLAPMATGDAQAVADWFARGMAPQDMHSAAAHGCLMVNSMREFGVSDADVAQRAARFHKMLRRCFCAALGRSTLRAGLDADDAAELCLGWAIAANVMNGAAGSVDGSAALRAAAARQIEAWVA